MNLQQVFDAALFGLREQRVASVNPGTGECAYRGLNGHKCGIGQSMPDDVYDPKFDEDGGVSIHALVTLPEYYKVAKAYEGIHPHDILELQSIHDMNLAHPGSDEGEIQGRLELWEFEMSKFARKHGLNYDKAIELARSKE